MNSRAPWPLRILGRLVGLAIILTGIAAAVITARTSAGNPRTDDAYVSANVIGIAPHVQGPLVQLTVVDNQPVEENDLLFVVDPRPYEAELERARGELILAQAEVGGIEQAIAAARAEVARLRADTAFARTHAGRLEPLLGGRFISADQYQEAVTKAKSLDAAVQHAQSQLAQQEQLLAQQGDMNGRLETAKARLRLAELNVEYCYVRAPFKGLASDQSQYFCWRLCSHRRACLRTGRSTHVVRAGELPRDPVAGDQAGHGGAGEPRRRSWPDLSRRCAGIAWSVLSPSGQTVGVLPKVDPTLNWARLAQRIPVRIILDLPPPDAAFRMGMTAVATITGFPADGKPLSVPGMPVASAQ